MMVPSGKAESMQLDNNPAFQTPPTLTLNLEHLLRAAETESLLSWLSLVRADQVRRWQRGQRVPVESYLAFGAAVAPWTFLDGVRGLLPGESWCFDLGVSALRPVRRRYWRPAFARQDAPPLPREEALERLRPVLREAVSLRGRGVAEGRGQERKGGTHGTVSVTRSARATRIPHGHGGGGKITPTPTRAKAASPRGQESGVRSRESVR